MRIAICDDEWEFVETLLKKLKLEFEKRNEKCSFFTASSGEELLSLCASEKIDAVFLDIMLPELSGFDIAARLRETKKDIMLVFVSSKESTVFSSYEYNPVWFVPKSQLQLISPVTDKLINRLRYLEDSASVVQIKLGNKVEELDIRKIKYFKTEGHYINYFCTDGCMSESFRCRIDDVEAQLGKLWFVRTHSRYLVNLRQIHSISGSNAVLCDKEEIPISRAQMNIVKEKFQDYLRSIR